MNKAALTLLLAGCETLLPHVALAQTTSNTKATAQQEAGLATATVEELRQRLAAQQAINEQLRLRVNALEQQLATKNAGNAPPVVALDTHAEMPPVDPESDAATTAIEQALVSKGLVLLPSGTYQLTPGFTWVHSGSGDTRRESYRTGLTVDAGLPWGMAASVNVPYVHRDYAWGHNAGTGDVSLSLSKKLTQETQSMPSLILRMDYLHDNGKDAFDPVPVGAGFRSAYASLSAVKRADPLVIYGSLSYGHSWAKTTTYWDGAAYQSGRITPGDSYGIGMGLSLAATPDISIDTGLSFDFKSKSTIAPEGGAEYQSARTTAGYLNLATSFVLRKNLFLNLSAAAGVTDDAEDFIFTVSLPYRF
jgi:hypothetical protein